MDTHPTHLTVELTHWVTSALALRRSAEFSYDTGDPLAVTLIVEADGNRLVRWVFARDLLTEGLAARAGEGDVALWPVDGPDGERSAYCLRLGSTRTALFEIPAAPVVRWLAGTYALVARGAELDGVDWDVLVQPAE
ncbi:SsgA family sporulation/cell division regulator [Streptomyces sp. NPDC046716]|uniref:SsgA family sporulation/cell division regulator n=1 Tax=Streptomyces sp. NPDC046716 TaxID=3157093 RepID=UPI0033F8DE4E